MLYLANPCSAAVVAAMRDGHIGLIDTPRQRNAAAVAETYAADVPWCADNGCFGTGYPGDEAWLGWLEANAYRASSCLFATAPDVVGDAAATLERSTPWLPKIRELGYPAAFVAQDGLERMTVPWDSFDVLFIGGSTEWKLGAAARELVAEAKRHGKRVHMGRVNSGKRYRYAMAIGCDSADGTKLTFGPDVNLPTVLSWGRLADHSTLQFDEMGDAS